VIAPTTEVIEQVNNDDAENQEAKVSTPKSEIPRDENQVVENNSQNNEA